MLDTAPTPISLTVFGLIAIVIAVGALSRGRFRVPPYLRYLGALWAILTVADWYSFRWAIWLLAAFSFLALREFFSLVDIRLQDRWGIIGAYASIPFMIHYIDTNWYGMFIISVPVYAFVVIPFLVAFGGGDPHGTVFSIGLIDFGLFLFAYCVGHIGYLTYFSVRMAILLVVAVAYCDFIYRRVAARHPLPAFALAVAGTAGIALALSSWTTIPTRHCAALGGLIPFLVFAGSFTVRAMEQDLGISPERLEPGRGLVLNSLKAYLFPAPIVFHYLRWFLHWGEL